MKILVKAIITMIALAPLAVGCGTAGAATITLSDLSSDGTPAGVLSATLEFTVSDSILTLNVTNDTSAPNEYIINQVYFNAGDTIEGLTLTSNSGWSLLTDTAAGGFGVFDFFLDGGTGNDPNLIQPGGTQTFTFGIGGTGPFSDTDFVAYSTIPPGNLRPSLLVSAAPGLFPIRILLPTVRYRRVIRSRRRQPNSSAGRQVMILMKKMRTAALAQRFPYRGRCCCWARG
jgi:hypothetical protein